MALTLCRRIGEAVCLHACSKQEWADLVAAGEKAGTFDALSQDMQDLLAEVEARPTRAEVWTVMEEAGALFRQMFHLPGEHDQRTHGRRKITPNDDLHEAPTGELADHMAKWHRDLTDLTSLMAAIDSGYGGEDLDKLAGGHQKVHRVRYKNGTVGVMKTATDAEAVREIDAEQLTGLTGRLLGIPVPRVARVLDDTIVMDHVAGMSGFQEAMADPIGFRDWVTQTWPTKDVQKLGFLDLLTDNLDRHDGNWIKTPEGRVVGIDHGHTFMDLQGMTPGLPDEARTTDYFSDAWLEEVGGRTEWAANPLTEEDVTWIRARIMDLEDDFAALDHHDWWEFMLGRFEAMARNQYALRWPGTPPPPSHGENLFAPSGPGLSASGTTRTTDPIATSPLATFHLPGLHDQESHGNWSTGGSREYTGPRWQLPDSVTPERFDRLRQAARKYARLSRMDGVAWNDERKRKANDELFAAQEGWPYANPEDQVARARAMREGQLLASLDEWRESNGIDEPEDKLLDRLAEETRQAFAGKKVAVRVTDAQLGRILERGRFSTQFESKRSKGLNDNGVRAEYEAATFGFAADVPPDQRAAHSPETRPVYGYVMVDGVRPAGLGSKDLLAPSTDALSQYGRVQVVLRDDVRERTTAMYGDGLNNGANGAPSAINDPTWEAFTPSWKSMVGTAFAGPTREPDSQFFRSSVYAEAQIHGGVSVDDIEEVVFPANPSAALRKQLDDAGVKWRVHSYSTAATADDPAERAQALKQALQDQQFLRAEIAESTDKIEQYRARNDSYTVNQLEKEVALLQKQLTEVEKALPKLQEASGVVAAGAPAEGQLVARRGDGAELVTAGGEAAMLMTDAGRYLTTVTSAVARGDDWAAVDPVEAVQVSPDELAQLKQYDQELAVAGTVAVLTASGATFHLPGQHDQRTHGKRGLLPPGEVAKPGQPQGTLADHVALWNRDLSELGGLVASVQSGEVSGQALSGGQMGDTRRVAMADGRVLVKKKMKKADKIVGPILGDPARQADAEQLAGLLGSHIGAPVPRVLRTDPDEVVMDLVPGETWAQLRVKHKWDSKTDAVKLADAAETSDGLRLGLFDLLTDNWDRGNPTNIVMAADGSPRGIDHAMTWGMGELGENDPSDAPLVDYTSPFSLSYLDYVPPPAGAAALDHRMKWDKNPLHPDDVGWLRDRLDDLRDDFEVLGRLEWWEFASRRLDAIGAGASGTRRLFGV